jgi:uncharacterized spore protein YtfJ
MTEDEPTPTEPTRAENLVSRLSEKLAITASTQSVYGEPIHAGNRTLIPVAKIGYCLGGTSGGRDGEKIGGGSGGGMVGGKPVGYIEITDQSTRYVAISTSKKIIASAVVGFVIGYLLRHSRQRTSTTPN